MIRHVTLLEPERQAFALRDQPVFAELLIRVVETGDLRTGLSVLRNGGC